MMRFNHVANRVDGRHFDTVAAMLTEKLGFVELRRTERSAWFRQPGTNVDLQLSRSDTERRDPDKRRSQVSFLSGTPRADLDDLAAWAQAHGLAASVGSYSDREFYLDAPEAFVDFVIEAMLPELADLYRAVQFQATGRSKTRPLRQPLADAIASRKAKPPKPLQPSSPLDGRWLEPAAYGVEVA